MIHHLDDRSSATGADGAILDVPRVVVVIAIKLVLECPREEFTEVGLARPIRVQPVRRPSHVLESRARVTWRPTEHTLSSYT